MPGSSFYRETEKIGIGRTHTHTYIPQHPSVPPREGPIVGKHTWLPAPHYNVLQAAHSTVCTPTWPSYEELAGHPCVPGDDISRKRSQLYMSYLVL